MKETQKSPADRFISVSYHEALWVGKAPSTHLDIEILLEPLKLVLLGLVRLYELFQCVLDLWGWVVHIEMRRMGEVGLASEFQRHMI